MECNTKPSERVSNELRKANRPRHRQLLQNATSRLSRRPPLSRPKTTCQIRSHDPRTAHTLVHLLFRVCLSVLSHFSYPRTEIERRTFHAGACRAPPSSKPTANVDSPSRLSQGVLSNLSDWRYSHNTMDRLQRPEHGFRFRSVLPMADLSI